MTGTPRRSSSALAAGLAGAAVLAGLGLTAYVALRPQSAAFADCPGVAVGATIGGPFTLVSETGETVTDADVLDQPSLVYFGYTFCPDICPTDAARNADAVDLLAERGLSVQPVFITVDPARDTPKQLAEFTDLFHPKMIGLTGTEEQVTAAAKAYKAFFRKGEGEGDFYLMDHSTQTYLMLPGYGFVTFFKSSDSAEDMAEAAACYLGHAS